MPYLKANWPHVLLTLSGSAVSIAFALGFAWAVLGTRLSATEHRLEEMDALHVPELRWQVQQDAVSITTIHADARHTEAEVSQINTRLGVIDAKLDAIAETLKRKP